MIGGVPNILSINCIRCPGESLVWDSVDDYKQLVELKTKLTRKEARPKYTKDSNLNKKSKGWLRKRIKRYNDLIKIVRLSRTKEVSKEMEFELN